MTRAAVTYVTVSDARFFAGTVALVNSLRLTGNGGDVVVLDCGLRARQRDLLATEACVVPVVGVPDLALAKPSASRLGLRGTLVFVDSDALVCGSLSPIVERARAGAVCLFPDRPATRGKRQDEWRAFFELERPPRAQTYGNAGFVVFSTEAHPTLLERWWTACRRFSPPVADWATTPDQDALNALLMSEVPAQAVELLPERRRPASRGARRGLGARRAQAPAALDGRPVRVLHSPRAEAVGRPRLAARPTPT